jgi:hypothetical protein
MSLPQDKINTMSRSSLMIGRRQTSSVSIFLHLLLGARAPHDQAEEGNQFLPLTARLCHAGKRCQYKRIPWS